MKRFLFSFLFSIVGFASLTGFASLATAAPMAVSAPVTQPASVTTPILQPIIKWCRDLKAETVKLGWTLEVCDSMGWKHEATSVEGRPLVYAEYGNPAAANTTLVFASVHGDEITPVYLGIELAHWLKSHSKDLANAHVIVAPLVNPDGFFRKPRRRTNAHGVDCNRNFDTLDWKDHALQAWKAKFKSDPRRYPGPAPRSEPETIFQEELIKKFRPQKVLSVHSPLNFIDYDGPNALSLAKFPSDYVAECLKLRKRLNAISSGFFPGSLGNFAGQELGIPTLTLELPTADPRKAELYWQRFSRGIQIMIDYVVPNVARASSSKPS